MAFVALLTQPCAMAMEMAPAEHPATCQHELANETAPACLSQPIAECVASDWAVDNRDNTTPKLDLLALPVASPGPAVMPARIVALPACPGCSPPRCKPAIYLLNCVFLK